MSAERVAIYCRLSQEDRDKNYPDAESRSIKNQKALLIQYAKERNWQITEIYSDEDYSGSDRERPAFCRMIADGERRKFDIILCKSQSRFTRELELVEHYIHGLFPQWGIRFVSVTDHVDSGEPGGRKARQLSGLINQWYLEDLSDSIRAVLRDHQRQGRHIGSFAPYGYRKDPAQQGHLLPDEAAATVVKRIFRTYADGKGKGSIAGELNREGIPNPSAYKAVQGSSYRGRYPNNSGLWRSSTVDSILRNQLYRGDMVQHRREKLAYNSKNLRNLPREQWIVVKDCHQPLIEDRLWQAVQQRLQERSTASFGGRKGIFAGKLRCLYCGQSMRRCKSGKGRAYYRCGGAQVHSGCTGAFIPAEELKEAIWRQFSEEINKYFDETQLVDKNDAALERQLTDLEQAEKRLHFQLICGKISEEWAAEFREELQLQAQEVKRKLEDSRKRVFLPDELTKPLIEAFIDSIEVGKRDKTNSKVPLRIHWRF